MINLIIDKINRFKLNGLFKKISSQETKFNSFLKENQSVFIILPNSEEQLKQSEKVLQFLLEQNKNLIVFSDVDTFERFSLKSKCRIVEFNINEINKLNLPNDVLKKRLANEKSSVCIDLNKKHTIFNVFVMGLIKFKYRIGFKDGEFDNYFNLLIDETGKSESDSYTSMISSLKMFL